jgi:hypothetical protein
MAQQNIWNPNEQYNIDQQNGQYPPTPTAATQQDVQQQPAQAPPSSGFDLGAWYQQMLGRAPDENERSSDAANIDKYGPSAFMSDFQKRLAPTASNGGSGGSAAQPAQGGSNDWYKSYFDDMRARATAADAERKAKADSLYNTWLGRSQQALNIDRNDPIIRQQSDAYAANEERSRRNYISDVAEGAGPLGNLRGEERMAAERMGQRTGNFEAELVGRELQTRRNEIAQALGQMGNMLSADQQAGLQRELAILDQSIREQGLALQGRGLDQDLERALMANNQFYADLGLRAENQYNYWNDPLRTRA